MIKSPKEKFQESQTRREQWEKIALTNTFNEACDSSLLQMLSMQPDSVESHYRMTGAQQFLRTLKTIHEPPQETTEKKVEKLNYQAGV